MLYVIKGEWINEWINLLIDQLLNMPYVARFLWYGNAYLQIGETSMLITPYGIWFPAVSWLVFPRILNVGRYTRLGPT